MRIAHDADVVASVPHSLTVPTGKRAHRTKKGTGFVRRRLAKEGTSLLTKDVPRGVRYLPLRNIRRPLQHEGRRRPFAQSIPR